MKRITSKLEIVPVNGRKRNTTVPGPSGQKEYGEKLTERVASEILTPASWEQSDSISGSVSALAPN